MPNSKDLYTGWKLFLLWILASAIGSIVGISASMALLGVVSESLAIVVFVLLIGLAQWFVLRRHLQHSTMWILANTLGALLGFVGLNVVHQTKLWTGNSVVDGALGFAVFGLMIGVIQWLLLRKDLFKAGWWILLSTVGWFVGGLVVWWIGLRFSDFIKVVVDYFIIGVIIGIFTGFGLILLKKKPDIPTLKKTDFIANLALVVCALIVLITVNVLERADLRLDDLGVVPDRNSKPDCDDLPPVECVGGDEYCSEVVLFEPITGTGYINNPNNGETWDDQYRSYLRRDLMMMVQYATARVACETSGWVDSLPGPLDLGDMSEADGSIPGTSVGRPGHPMGTHQNGLDIDIAYYQKDIQSAWLQLEYRWQGVEGNLLRSVCKHTRFGVNINHCTEASTLLDPWRTALFIAFLSEHPNLRVIGVDGQIGPVLESALDQLELAGWIDADLRKQIPMAYEEANEGMGWFWYHHHHMHISMQPD